MNGRIVLSGIRIGRRMRPLDAAKVKELADSIRRVGLLHPLLLTADSRLIAGHHRLEAVRRLGWKEVSYETLAQGDALNAELAEIDENLIRAELTTLQRSQHVTRREAILVELNQRQQVGRPVGNGVTVTPLRTTADLAADLGVSKETVKRYKRIGGIAAEAQDLLADTPIANSTTQLLDLAHEVPEVQVAAASLIAAGTVATVREALETVRPVAVAEPEPDEEEDEAPLGVEDELFHQISGDLEGIGQQAERLHRAFTFALRSDMFTEEVLRALTAAVGAASDALDAIAHAIRVPLGQR